MAPKKKSSSSHQGHSHHDHHDHAGCCHHDHHHDHDHDHHHHDHDHDHHHHPDHSHAFAEPHSEEEMASLAEQFEQVTSIPIEVISYLTSGNNAELYRARFKSGEEAVIKVAEFEDYAVMDQEAAMLIYLKEHTELPVPEVYGYSPSILAMAYIPHEGSITQAAEPHAATLLAGLHAITADQYGFDSDTLIGSLPQPNGFSDHWGMFYAEHRIWHMAHEAYLRGRLSESFVKKLERFMPKMVDMLPEHPTASLVHGDLWQGNILCQGDKVVGLIDPAIYYADREVELAFATLFGTFGSRFFECYQALSPIEPEFFSERMAIYQLYPLLVHSCLFGGSYTEEAEKIIARFL